jgi:hypothetical protein
MLQKYLLIGVGGSGGKTLRYAWRELDRRLRAAGWSNGVPQGWVFMHIDVPQEKDVIEGDVPADIGRSEHYIGLANAPRQYRDYDEELMQDHDPAAVAGWRPDPALDYAPPFRGAGQRRVVGRVVTLVEMEKVGAALDRTLPAMMSADVDEELLAVGRQLKADPNNVNPDPATAIVISSLAGGSGSGAFLDIVELLKARATNGYEWLETSLMTVLYSADVFGALPASQRTGVEPNSLAAISELISGFEHRGSVDPRETGLLRMGRPSMNLQGRRTAKTNFMIGARNNSVAFANPLDIFRGVGKALAVFMADDEVQRQFRAYIDTNAAGPGLQSDMTIGTPGNEMPCSSFGCSSVTLGRALFEQYAAERLAKLAVERLLRGHLERRRDDDFRNEETLIRERADDPAIQRAFFEACELAELGDEDNQILDALRDRNAKIERIRSFAGERRDALRKNVKFSPMESFRGFTREVDAAVRLFETAEATERADRAATWVVEIQGKVARATARAAGAYGLPVTAALLDALKSQLEQAAAELEGDSARYKKQEGDYLTSAETAFRSIRDAVINGTHEVFGNASEARAKALSKRTEADLFDFTAKIIRELVKDFLPALTRSVRNASSALAQSENGEYREMLAQWPGRAVPRHLQAAPNELLLVKQSEFPNKLEELLMGMANSDKVDDAISEALSEIVSCAWPSVLGDTGETPNQRLIRQTAEWRPGLTAARNPGVAVAAADFEAELDPRIVYERSVEWVRNRRGPVAEHVRESLGSWLSARTADAAERADRFADAMKLAMNQAEPLVSINEETFRQIHEGTPPEPVFVISRIPMARDHRAYDRVMRVLMDAGLSDGESAGLFDPNVGGAAVEVTSFLGTSVHPMVMDSIMNPIQREWKVRADEDSAARFWRFRRARPLTSFVRLARGWLTADILGYVPVLNGPWSASPLDVWSPAGRLSLPPRLLGREVKQHTSVLPALLESLPLAFLSFASGTRGELQAYLRLLELGQSGDGADEAYTELNQELAGWILSGELPDADPGCVPAPTPPTDTAGTHDDALEGRGELISRRLRELADGYELSVGAQRVTKQTSLTLSRDWEAADLIIQSARTIAEAVERCIGSARAPVASRVGVPGMTT